MNDAQPLVSIITAAYNRASYLDETIQSVLTQDYLRIEYIVLDDGSTDNTREVLKKYNGQIIWESHPNMGETRTINKGLGMAHGDIIAIVNSDDPLLPSAVNTAVAFMQGQPDILVAYPDWNYIGPDSKVRSRVELPEYEYMYMLRRHFCTPGPGAFIRRRAIELAGMRDPDFKYAADFEYWLRLGLYGKFAHIPKTLATFRVHPDSASVSSKGTVMANEQIRLLEKLYNRPDLPMEVLAARSEAFGWAHYVAALKCGADSCLARIHIIKAISYHPSILIQERLNCQSIILPKPVSRVLHQIWLIVRPVLSKCFRFSKRAIKGIY